MAETINVLHITDVHFGGPSRPPDEVLQALLDKFATAFAEGKKYADWKPDYVFLTGDVAYYGGKDDYQKDVARREYTKAKKFLSDLSNAIGVPRQNFAFCPGNHDNVQSETWAQLAPTQGKNGVPISEFADRNLVLKNLDKLNDSFRPYINFVKDFYGSDYDNCKLFLRDGKEEKDIENVTCGVKVMGKILLNVLNTAWFCCESVSKVSDQANLFVGNELVMALRDYRRYHNLEADKNLVSITLLHHGFNWWAWNENYLGEKGNRSHTAEKVFGVSEIVLNGHEHGNLQAPVLYKDKVRVFTGGALFESTESRNNCEVLKINPQKSTIERLLVNFDPSGGTFVGTWKLDIEKEQPGDEDSDKKVYTYGRASAAKTGIDPPPDNKTESTQQIYVTNRDTEVILKQAYDNLVIKNALTDKEVVDHLLPYYLPQGAAYVKKSDWTYVIESNERLGLVFVKLPESEELIQKSDDLNKVEEFCEENRNIKKYIIVYFDSTTYTGTFEELSTRKSETQKRYQKTLSMLGNTKKMNKLGLENRLLIKLEILDNKALKFAESG